MLFDRIIMGAILPNKKWEDSMSEQQVNQKGYPVTFSAEYAEKMSRLTTFFRYFMVIPHLIVLYFVSIAASVITFIAWWAILFTGKYPKGMWDFMVGYMRWSTRVNGYSYFLTDKYPPFNMNP
jgi:hypothetical protein